MIFVVTQLVFIGSHLVAALIGIQYMQPLMAIYGLIGNCTSYLNQLECILNTKSSETASRMRITHEYNTKEAIYDSLWLVDSYELEF